jgi:tetratricopeptide (TPR) repeat protein
MLTTWKQINEKYNVILNGGNDGELSEIEKKIYNGTFSQDDIDFSDVNVLLALSNYYMLTKNDSFRLTILNKLVELGDHRGHANLGCYYFNINRELAIIHFEKASQLGNLNAKFNLVKHYIEVADLEKGYILCEELVQSNYIPAYMLLAQIYGWKGNFQKMMETLGKGIEKEDQNCMSSLELALENNFVQIKQFLGGLTPNNLITNKINQINSVMSGTGFMLSMKRI